MDITTEKELNPSLEDNRPWIPIIEKFPEKDGLYEVTVDQSSVDLNRPNYATLIEYNQKHPLPLWDLNSRYERIVAWREKPKPYQPICSRFPYYGGIWIHRNEIQKVNFEFNVRSGSVKWVIETYDKKIIFPYNFNGVYCFNEKSGINKMLHIYDIDSNVEFLFSFYKRNEDTKDYLYNYFGFGHV